jgi:hypothetical protein
MRGRKGLREERRAGEGKRGRGRERKRSRNGARK